MDEARLRKLQRIEELKKKPTQKPDWGGLMREISALKYGAKEKLRKVSCDDRSKPFLSNVKIQGKVNDFQNPLMHCYG